jgi:plasmid maintenance system antidote protein VapI
LRIPATRVAEIVKGNRRITADTALRLSLYFRNFAKFWLGIQDDFDIENENSLKKKEFSLITTLEREKINLIFSHNLVDDPMGNAAVLLLMKNEMGLKINLK